MVDTNEDRPGLKESITTTKELNLSYQDNVISFEFAGLHYIFPEKNLYAYIMDGFENEWNYVGHRRFATYTNLPTGQYTFRVRAANRDGIWNEKGHSINIIIHPPLWQMWWFRSLMLTFIVGVLVVFYKYRTTNIRRHNSELQKEIDEKMIAEAALRQSERNYREIFNTTSEAIFIHDIFTGAILDVNQTTLEMYGYTYNEVAGTEYW